MTGRSMCFLCCSVNQSTSFFNVPPLDIPYFLLLSSFQNLISRNTDTCPPSATFPVLICLFLIPSQNYDFQIYYVFHAVVTWLHKLERKIFESKDCHLFVHVSIAATRVPLAKDRRKCKNEAQKADCKCKMSQLVAPGECFPFCGWEWGGVYAKHW